MKAYIYKTGTTLSPFGDDVAEGQILLETLAETQARACRLAALELVRINHPAEATERPCLLWADYAYLSENALVTFLKTARTKGVKAARLALPKKVSVEFTLPLQDLTLLDWEDPKRARAAYDVWLLDAGELPATAGEVRAALEGRCPPLVLPFREIVAPSRAPAPGESDRAPKVAFTSVVCCHVAHWTHLLWIAQLAMGIAWNEYWRAHKWRAAGKLLGAMARMHMVNPIKAVFFTNVIGKGHDIHPTARVEFSQLGMNVKVGAGAYIRNSLIGDDVIIADHAVVTNSVVGRGCYLSENFFLVSSLCYPGSTLSNFKTQLSVIGRDVYLHGWFRLLDAKFKGDIQVMHKGKRVGTGRSFMGCCIGHRAVLGARASVHAGRELPNDLLVVSRPEDVIGEIPEHIPPRTPMVRHLGTLVPLDSLKVK